MDQLESARKACGKPIPLKPKRGLEWATQGSTSKSNGIQGLFFPRLTHPTESLLLDHRSKYHKHTRMAPVIRRFEPGDLARLHGLDQVCFAPDVAYSRAELRYYLTHPNCSCWIIEFAENKLAGFIIVERVLRNGQMAGHIVTLDVDPNGRRRGLGRLLMQSAESQMIREGASVISLEVAQNNTAARQFYRTLGFVARGTIANYYGGKIDAEVMQKVIASD